MFNQRQQLVKSNSIGEFLVKTCFRKDLAKSEDRDSDEWLHVSSLIDEAKHCRTYWWFSTHHGEENQTGAPTAAMNIVWKMGRAAEAHIRDRLVEAHINEGLGVFLPVGIWKCDCGFKEKRSEGMPKGVCKKCGTPLRNYDEFTIFDEEYKIVGNPDLLVKHKGQLHIVEFKSVRLKGEDKSFTYYKENETAEPKHKLQAAFYYYLLKNNGHNVNPNITVFYVAKDYSFKSPYYYYNYNAEELGVRESVGKHLQIAKWVKDSRFKEEAPPPKKCQTIEEAKKIKCPFAERCFQTFPRSTDI